MSSVFENDVAITSRGNDKNNGGAKNIEVNMNWTEFLRTMPNSGKYAPIIWYF